MTSINVHVFGYRPTDMHLHTFQILQKQNPIIVFVSSIKFQWFWCKCLFIKKMSYIVTGVDYLHIENCFELAVFCDIFGGTSGILCKIKHWVCCCWLYWCFQQKGLALWLLLNLPLWLKVYCWSLGSKSVWYLLVI